jgi:preprotein translocase subunit SecG
MNQLWTNLSSLIFAFAGVCLICLILLQRGRGGGLAGAFGTAGGQSAFGTKAGDFFTRITIGVALFWVAMAAVTGFAMHAEIGSRFMPG